MYIEICRWRVINCKDILLEIRFNNKNNNDNKH